MAYITTREAAARLKICPRLVTRYLCAGRLRGERITARLWLVDPRSVEEFIRKRRGRSNKSCVSC